MLWTSGVTAEGVKGLGVKISTHPLRYYTERFNLTRTVKILTNTHNYIFVETPAFRTEMSGLDYPLL